MKDTLRLEWQLYQLALRFLTCLPLARNLQESDDLRVRANKYFPLVGALLGVVGAVTFWMMAQWLPVSAALILALVMGLMITGGLFEEGLAKSIEGMHRGEGQTQILQMMAGPGLGLFGAISVALVVAMKLILLSHMDLGTAGAAMILAPVIAMMAVVHVIATTPYLHGEGLRAASPYITASGYRFALGSMAAIWLCFAFYVGFLPAACAWAGGTICAQLFRSRLVRNLRGYNSDCLGAVMLFAETGSYLGLSLWL